MKKIIVIGGGAAGAKAASKAKRLNPDNLIELYTNEDIIAFSLCGLPYYIEGSVSDVNKLIVRTPEDFKKNGINVFTNHTLEKIIPEENCVIINNNHIFYDQLILALGAKVHIPKIKNIKANNVYTLRSIASGVEIRNKMLKSKKVLIIGGGYISIELTEAFIKNGLEVVIIEKNEHLASDFDYDFADRIHKIIMEKSGQNCQILYSTQVVEFKKDENNNFISAITDKNEEIEADFVVLSTGAYPNVAIAASAGIHLGLSGAIKVDNRMRTNFNHIFAVGDCAEKYCKITRQADYIGLGTIANKEGRVAAINAVRPDIPESFDGILGSTITRFFDYTISKTGLSYKKAEQLSNIIDLEPIEATVLKSDRASYMPNASEFAIKLTADKRSGEILGGQAIGKIGTVAQRINTITSILQSRQTIEDILHLDLPYAPPFSGSIDPILTAAYKLKELSKK